ncbi:MAG TPA: FAD-binding protein, partial [bacterium]|nr:FAD-binding protein [bacterium]
MTSAVQERKCVDFSELKHLIHGKVLLNEPVASFTTYHLGGPAAALVEPQSVEELASMLRCLTQGQAPYLVLGGGSNVLFADEGYQGVVIRLGKAFQGIHIEGDRIRAKAGTK